MAGLFQGDASRRRFLTTIDAIRNKELGAIKIIQADSGQHQGGDLNQWRLKRSLAGGGALTDVGIYCLNATRYLTGEEQIEISAQLFSTPNDPRFKEVEESVTFQLRFPSGVLALCSTSYGSHEARRFRFESSVRMLGHSSIRRLPIADCK
jgi:predicted dehydrogenase